MMGVEARRPITTMLAESSVSGLLHRLVEVRKDILSSDTLIQDLRGRLSLGEALMMDLVEEEKRVRAAILAAIEIETDPHADAQ